MPLYARALVNRLLEKETTRYVGIVVLREHPKQGWQALIIQRTGPPEKGKWACPGGHVDKGESDEAAAFRELKEETGVEADEMTLFQEEDVDIGHLAFFWTVVEGGTRARASDDAGQSRWVDVTDIPELAWNNDEEIRKACIEACLHDIQETWDAKRLLEPRDPVAALVHKLETTLPGARIVTEPGPDRGQSLHLEITLDEPWTSAKVSTVRSRIERLLSGLGYIVVDHFVNRTHDENTYWFDPHYIPKLQAPSGWRPWFSRKKTRKLLRQAGL